VGDGVVDELAGYLARTRPGLQGFSRQNLFRMRQLYEVYRGDTKVSPLVRQLPWTHNLIILSQSASRRTRVLPASCHPERWTTRDLERQLRSSLFERSVMNPPKVSSALRQLHPGASEVFKDAYLVEFLDLPNAFSEADCTRSAEEPARLILEMGVISVYRLRVPLQWAGAIFLWICCSFIAA